MSDLEMEIGRTFGSSCFFVYQAIKFNPGLDAVGIQAETGLSPTCVWKCLVTLREENFIRYNLKVAGNRKEYRDYRINSKEKQPSEQWIH